MVGPDQPAAALRHARTILGRGGTLGSARELLRWAWPLATRAAHDLADTATAAELLAILNGHDPGELAPMQRAERDLARARLTTRDDGPGASTAFTAAIAGPAQPLHPLPPRPRAARPRRLPRRPGR